MKGVARGLQTLHGANVVRGSLHDNNVFAVNRKRGVLGDFDFTKSEVKNPHPLVTFQSELRIKTANCAIQRVY